CRDVAQQLANDIGECDALETLTDGRELPAFAFKLADGDHGFDVFDISIRLREGSWIVPAYTFPRNREDLAVLRIVVRNGFSQDLADILMDDLERVLAALSRGPGRHDQSKATSFHH
ncbi:MAG: glutamate decarboxylase, partial [Solirubrobacteraceae bacterium]|nr:glutamate decarboxylase [Solirubrobacteraceae bacterium]